MIEVTDDMPTIGKTFLIDGQKIFFCLNVLMVSYILNDSAACQMIPCSSYFIQEQST